MTPLPLQNLSEKSRGKENIWKKNFENLKKKKTTKKGKKQLKQQKSFFRQKKSLQYLDI